jgi:TetR/AcrR family transcriptional regulator, cholesterol catabolism regulator
MFDAATLTGTAPSAARARVLQTAAALFHAHGYQAVTMRDVARALGVKQASLYYHVPDGKEQLFVEVTARGLAQHQAGLTAALADAGPELQDQLNAAADWLTAQPALKLMHMFEADLPAITPANARYLRDCAYAALFQPLVEAFRQAQARGAIRAMDPDRLAGVFLTLIDGMMYASRAGHDAAGVTELAYELIDVLLNGLRPRAEAKTPGPETPGQKVDGGR